MERSITIIAALLGGIALVTLAVANDGGNLGMFNEKWPELGQTWTEIGDQICGAKPEAGSPIGGGAGYKNLISPPTEPVATLDELLAALEKASPGDIVYVDGNAE
jgi:hypothetical protein